MQSNSLQTKGSWTEKTLLIWDAKNREMVRRRFKVFNPFAKDLDFYWEPKEISKFLFSKELTGEGTITWRKSDLPKYDPKSIHSIYKGNLKNGKFHGYGELQVLENGYVYDGLWFEGEKQGDAKVIYENGDHYEGNFAKDLPNGKGVLKTVFGEIYEGNFYNGQKHGLGTYLDANGHKRKSRWYRNKESRVVAALNFDNKVSAKIKNDSNTVIAQRNPLSLGVTVRRNVKRKYGVGGTRKTFPYNANFSDGILKINPKGYEENFSLIKSWKKGGKIAEWGMQGGGPIFISLIARNNLNSRIYIEDLYVDVDYSYTDRHPVLKISPHSGCKGFRPTFDFTNFGWGKIVSGEILYNFTQFRQSPKTYRYKKVLHGFNNGKIIDVTNSIKNEKIDIEELRNQYYTCPSTKELPYCRSKLINTGVLGNLKHKIRVEEYDQRMMNTTIAGVFKYRWRDHNNKLRNSRNYFEVPIQLAAIKSPDNSECADLPWERPRPLPYPIVRLPHDRNGYSIRVPLQRAISVRRERKVTIEFRAQKSSIHRFRIIAILSNGDRVVSKPVLLQYYKTRKHKFFGNSISTKNMKCYISAQC
ncbi:hypothetical protein NBRC116602_29840 [Hyphomicrobiales bacterium 4NK60-0047b]